MAAITRTVHGQTAIAVCHVERRTLCMEPSGHLEMTALTRIMDGQDTRIMDGQDTRMVARGVVDVRHYC